MPDTPDTPATDPTTARLTVARDLAGRLDGPGSVACVLVGSVARGWADRWSDIELLIVRDHASDEDVRREYLTTAGLMDLRSFPADPPFHAEDDGRFCGLKVDLAHAIGPDLEAALRRLGTGTARDAALATQRLAASLLTGRPLTGEAAHERWREMLTPYPDGLAARIITEAVRFGPDAWLEMLAERGDVVPLHDALTRVASTLLVGWFALNDRYVATTDGKWLARHAATLPVVPLDAAGRVATMFDGALTERVVTASGLIADTLDLIDARFGPALMAGVRRRVRSSPRDPNWTPSPAE